MPSPGRTTRARACHARPAPRPRMQSCLLTLCPHPLHTHTAAMGCTHPPPLSHSRDGDSQLARSHFVNFARAVLTNAAPAAPGTTIWVSSGWPWSARTCPPSSCFGSSARTHCRVPKWGLGVALAHGENSPGWCTRVRRPERLRIGGSVLWVPLHVCVVVGTAARVCGGVRAACSGHHAAAAHGQALATTALVGVRACCGAGSGVRYLRRTRAPSGMRCQCAAVAYSAPAAPAPGAPPQ